MPGRIILSVYSGCRKQKLAEVVFCKEFLLSTLQLLFNKAQVQQLGKISFSRKENVVRTKHVLVS